MRAIVLTLHKATDTSCRLALYTDELGRKDITVFGRKNAGLYRPTTVLEVVLDRQKGTIHNLKEAVLLSAPDDHPAALMDALVKAEVLERSLREPMPDAKLFEVIEKNIKKSVPEFLHALSVGLGYGGQMLDEWRELQSLAIYEQIIQ